MCTQGQRTVGCGRGPTNPMHFAVCSMEGLMSIFLPRRTFDKLLSDRLRFSVSTPFRASPGRIG